MLYINIRQISPRPLRPGLLRIPHRQKVERLLPDCKHLLDPRILERTYRTGRKPPRLALKVYVLPGVADLHVDVAPGAVAVPAFRAPVLGGNHDGRGRTRDKLLRERGLRKLRTQVALAHRLQRVGVPIISVEPCFQAFDITHHGVNLERERRARRRRRLQPALVSNPLCAPQYLPELRLGDGLVLKDPARAARLYFKSVANQTRFVLLRDTLADDANPLSPGERKECLDRICRVLEEEIAVAREMFTLARVNSCVGYEPASQYFYLPLDLVEKVVNCRQLLDHYTTQRKRPNAAAKESG